MIKSDRVGLRSVSQQEDIGAKRIRVGSGGSHGLKRLQFTTSISTCRHEQGMF